MSKNRARLAIIVLMALVCATLNCSRSQPPIGRDINVEIWELTTTGVEVMPEEQEEQPVKPEATQEGVGEQSSEPVTPAEEEEEHPTKPEPIPFIEVHLTCNPMQGMEEEEFQSWLDEIVDKLANTEGCLKAQASLNVLDSPRIEITSWWQAMDDWTQFVRDDYWQSQLARLHSSCGTDLNVELWRLDNPLTLAPEEGEQHPVKPEPTNQNPEEQGEEGANQQPSLTPPEEQEEQPVKPEPFTGAGIEVDLTFNLNPDVEPETYERWVRRSTTKIRNAAGCLGWCTSRNILDSPRMRVTSWWKSLDSWANFAESDDWQTILRQLSERHAAEADRGVPAMVTRSSTLPMHNPIYPKSGEAVKYTLHVSGDARITGAKLYEKVDTVETSGFIKEGELTFIDQKWIQLYPNITGS